MHKNNIKEKGYLAIHKFLSQQFVTGSIDFNDLPDGNVRITDKSGDQIILKIDPKTMNIYDSENIIRGYNNSGKTLKESVPSDWIWK